MGRVVIHCNDKISVKEYSPVISRYEQLLKPSGVKIRRYNRIDSQYNLEISLLSGRKYLLDEGGGLMTTKLLLEKWKNWKNSNSNINLIIGPTDGFSEELLISNDSFSLSPLTFQKDLALLVILEQLWRVDQINKGKPYHRS